MPDEIQGEIQETALPALAGTPLPTMTIAEVKRRGEMIEELLREVLVEGKHFGTIPGVKGKALYKAGAEKINLHFMFVDELLEQVFEPEVRDPDTGALIQGHREVRTEVKLFYGPTMQLVGSCIGVCSTMESKYRYRMKKIFCPKCGTDAVIRNNYGPGYICLRGKGCGTKFPQTEPAIVEQKPGRIENPDLADTYNTVHKMAFKRGYIGATQIATGSSDLFIDPAASEGRRESKKPAAGGGGKEALDKAIAEMRQQVRSDGVAQVWEANPKLQNFKEFKDAREEVMANIKHALEADDGDL